MKDLIEYTEHSMTSLQDTLAEGLLDMDEKAADKAVINSNLKKIIKQFNQYTQIHLNLITMMLWVEK